MGNAAGHIIGFLGAVGTVATADADALARANEGAQLAAYATSETATLFEGFNPIAITQLRITELR